MIHLFIGHRGTGKTSLLKRLENYFKDQEYSFIDLDSYIENKEKMILQEIFTQKGESYFRELEKKYYHEISETYKNKNLYMALGAGFSAEIRRDHHVIWVRRPTDSLGRIFLDRPKLEDSLNPLDEYQVRFLKREKSFFKEQQDILTLPEGFDFSHLGEKLFFQNGLNKLMGAMTLFPRHLKNLKKRISSGVKYFELRDDLLSIEELNYCLENIPNHQSLISLRKNPEPHPVINSWLKKDIFWDWPLEFGECRRGEPPLVSLHEFLPHETFLDGAKRVLNYPKAKFFKLAPLTHDFKHLLQGHQWMMEDPEHRTFLPRSQDGRWSWYRLWVHQLSFLNFFREDEGIAPDQPWLLEWALRKSSKHFAAVLGNPVTHSRSCAEHYDVFDPTPFLRINIEENEWDQAISVLRELGLVWAAVTSPLKIKAFKSCDQLSSLAKKYGSVNTLVLKDHQWYGTNTDGIGFQSLIKNQTLESVIVWGGRGTLSVIKEFLPNATYYSSRTTQPREENKLNQIFPKTLIWAASQNESNFPPSSWKPKVVIDLNYIENSNGKNYAFKIGAQYRSGLTMFKAQAKAQQEFWKSHGV